MTKFKVGDTVRCKNTNGWGDMRWFDKKPFVARAEDLEHLNGEYFEDFVLVTKYKKEIEVYGIVKFCKKYYK